MIGATRLAFIARPRASLSIKVTSIYAHEHVEMRLKMIPRKFIAKNVGEFECTHGLVR